ncbi:hypothetical protein FGF1_42920 [Flavobacteriaceae bacterium GF1]
MRYLISKITAHPMEPVTQLLVFTILVIPPFKKWKCFDELGHRTALGLITALQNKFVKKSNNNLVLKNEVAEWLEF